ncbi:MAG: hypothetical protein Q9175_001264 [Cornicularia normoerica]
MAPGFLDQLPKVNSRDLPSDAECMICQEEYGTVASDNGVIEHPVLLPCLHHVGSECIATWLSPEDGPGNSCPMCRTVFFPSQSEDYIDEDEDEEDSQDEDSEGEYSDEGDENESEDGVDGDDGEGNDGPQEPAEDENDRVEGRAQTPMTLLSAYQRLTISPINTSTHKATEYQDGQEWFECWPVPTNQQVEDSRKCARQELLRPSPSRFMQTSPPQIYSSPFDFESKVTKLASAYLTMAFRETLLYLKLVRAGSRIPSLEFPHRGLSAHQEEALLWELGQRGAFRSTNVGPGQMVMTNRESWYVHRAKGEVYTYEIPPASGQGYWVTDLELDFE